MFFFVLVSFPATSSLQFHSSSGIFTLQKLCWKKIPTKKNQPTGRNDINIVEWKKKYEKQDEPSTHV